MLNIYFCIISFILSTVFVILQLLSFHKSSFVISSFVISFFIISFFVISFFVISSTMDVVCNNYLQYFFSMFNNLRSVNNNNHDDNSANTAIVNGVPSVPLEKIRIVLDKDGNIDMMFDADGIINYKQ